MHRKTSCWSLRQIFWVAGSLTLSLVLSRVVFHAFYNFSNQTVIHAVTTPAGTKDPAVHFWFFALDCTSSFLHFYAKQAVLSARRHTKLVPVLMLHCRNPELEKWMQDHGVVISDPKNSSLVQFLDSHKEKLTNLGATTWYRMAIPHVIEVLKETKHPRIVQALKENAGCLQYVLYTDVDVVFVKSFNITSASLPRYFSLPVQGNSWCCSDNTFSRRLHSNAGVILMNVTAMREVQNEFTKYVIEKILQNSVTDPRFNDQTAFHRFFPIRLQNLSLLQMLQMAVFHPTYFQNLFSSYYSDTLPKEYEWEPYLGVNKDALIIHWHGPKVYLDSCAALTMPLLAEKGQLILKQLALANRTIPHRNYVSQQESRSSVLQPLSTAATEHVSDSRSNNPESEYPPAYDWFAGMPAVTPTERAQALRGAEKDFFFLQTLTAESLDGYHYATSLLFDYVHLICTLQDSAGSVVQ